MLPQKSAAAGDRPTLAPSLNTPLRTHVCEGTDQFG